MKIQLSLLSALKICILASMTLFLTISTAEASRVAVNIGEPVAPYPYGGENVVYVPGHWHHGIWIGGQYVESPGPQPGPDYIWVGGVYGSGHHWNRGHWTHGGRHYHHH